MPLFLFFGFGVLATLISNFIIFPSHRDTSVFRNNLEAITTLIAGVAFYLAASYSVSDERQLKKSLHWINIGGAFIIVLCFLQFFVWKFLGYYPDSLFGIQGFLTMSNKLYEHRVTAVALEPSWVAHQLNLLYLPLWVAFSFKRVSIYKTLFLKKISIENILLAGGLFSLFATFSRIGWLTFLALLSYLFFRWANRKKLWVKNRFVFFQKIPAGLFALMYWVSIIFIIVLLGCCAVMAMRVFDSKRMASVFAFLAPGSLSLLAWANKIEMAERFIYWGAAFYTFLAFPIFGVGLGNAGFFFESHMHSFGYGSPEIMQKLLFDSSLVNAKNFWMRILAETGLMGFVCFVSWLYVHLKMSMKLEKSSANRLSETLGLAGILLLITFIFEGLSMDTFALPYFWICFGLVLGVKRYTNFQEESETKNKRLIAG
ncbi:MAG: O-antigen ligase family protein [Anaerolineaceae bacterium]|nr:O-antigen ligase family protein [Anaerolineaceae bacterium]